MSVSKWQSRWEPTPSGLCLGPKGLYGLTTDQIPEVSPDNSFMPCGYDEETTLVLADIVVARVLAMNSDNPKHSRSSTPASFSVVTPVLSLSPNVCHSPVQSSTPIHSLTLPSVFSVLLSPVSAFLPGVRPVASRHLFPADSTPRHHWSAQTRCCYPVHHVLSSVS